MIRVRTTVTGSDLSKRGSKAAMREASDWGWDYHRRRYMPFHFKKDSYHRYPEYSKNKPSRTKNSRTRRKVDSRDGKSRLWKEQSKKEADKLRDQRIKEGKTKNESKLPLVRTGYLRNKILRGPVKHTGASDKRGITYSAPRYTYINPAGSINKVDALHSMTAKEEEDVVGKVGDQFFKNLDKRKSTKKG